MIAVDVNVLLYLVLRGDHTQMATDALRKDPDWRAPRLWRSEMLNGLTGYIRRGDLDVPRGLAAFDKARRTVRGEPMIRPGRILDLVSTSSCSAYDCEYVAAAEFLGCKLVTNDRKIIRDFPGVATSIADFVAM
ncbi:MAG: type II toxin-antitoxin system VapC family toxin [Acidobacteria bacterium]|nr:type II toxin-antitoxin system VapC family toxin [Acidobacteriota bacterium]